MSEIDNFKSSITYENKTAYGIIGIILGLLFWGISGSYTGIMDIILLIFSCIFLVIPTDTTKNSSLLSTFSIIFLVLALLVILGGSYYLFSSLILQLILCIYGIFCAVLMRIPTVQPVKNSNAQKTDYEKYCSKCGQGLSDESKLCSQCGAEVVNNIQIKQDMYCKKCGEKLMKIQSSVRNAVQKPKPVKK